VSTGEECTAAQLIAEITIIRRYKKKNQTLPHKFWNEPLWKKEFKTEIIAAHALLRVYQEDAIVKAVKSKNAEWITSLRIKKLVEYIKEEVQNCIKQQESLSMLSTISVKDTTSIRNNAGTKTKFDRLKDF
jgi:hypothetical protein